MAVHVRNYVGTYRDHLVLGVFPYVQKRLLHQDSCVALTMVLGINLSVNKVPFAWHKAVISQTNPNVVNPNLATMCLLIVNNFWFHAC